jgi:uncharacterized protein (DUF1778 family)
VHYDEYMLKTGKGKRIGLDVSPELHKELRMAAAWREQTISDFVRDAIGHQIKATQWRSDDPPRREGRHRQ